MNEYLVKAGRGLVCLLVLTAAPHAGAFDLGEIDVHGFVTTTYSTSDHNNVFTLNTEDGDFNWFEAGINFNIEPVDNLRIGMQLYSRTMGDQGGGDVVIDWATGDYRIRDWFGVRIGKNKLPVGLYNTTRDADMTRPTIILPQSVYSENLRDLINAYIGGEVYGSIGLGDSSDLEYQVFYGTQDLGDSFVIRRFMENGAVAGLNFLPLPLDQPTYTIDNIDVDMDYIVGAALRWYTPLDGLRFGATFQQSEANFSSRTVYSGWMQQGPTTVPVSFAVTTDTIYNQIGSGVVSGEYRKNKLVLAAEYWWAANEIGNTMGGLPFPLPSMPAIETDSEAYYGQASYRFTDWFELSSYYSVYYPDKDDKNGDSYVARGQSSARAWSKDLTLSARFDITRYMLFKLEGHFVDGTALVSPLDNPQGLEDDFTLVLGRFTFYF